MTRFSMNVSIPRMMDIRPRISDAPQTLAALPGNLEGSTTAVPVRGAVVLQEGGSRDPLFLPHEFSGLGRYFAGLAAAVDPGITVYGLVPPEDLQLRTVEGLAARMVRIVREIQPKGPYRVVGWSFGGILAYEIAVQLIGQNQEVGFLGLLDTCPPLDLARQSNPLSALTPQECVLDFILQLGPDEAELERHLRQLSERLSFDEFVLECQKLEIPEFGNRTSKEITVLVDRTIAHANSLLDYAIRPISMPIHLFLSEEWPKEGTEFLGWDEVLPREQITVIRTSGTHRSMVEMPRVEELGKALSAALELGSNRAGCKRGRQGELPMVIQTGVGDPEQVVCFPGAGAQVTDFVHFGAALGRLWSLYGVRHQGLDLELPPHSSVESAADTFMERLDSLTLRKPVHLVGHSFGGWIAFEVANRLRSIGKPVASLTLIDSESPGLGERKEYTSTEALLEFIGIVEQSRGTTLGIERRTYEQCGAKKQIAMLHAAMVRRNILPKRTIPDVLHGPISQFSAALRMRYEPRWVYQEPAWVVVADDSKFAADTNYRRQEAMFAGWKRYAPVLGGWKGPGNHTTILQPPNIGRLIDWWRSTITGNKLDDRNPRTLVHGRGDDGRHS